MLTLLLAASLAHARPAASSVGEDEGGKHPAEDALDGLLATGWAEGEPGKGDGAWWEFDLPAATKIESVSLWPGNLSEGKKSFREYGRPKLIKLYVDGQPQGEAIRLLDEMQRKDIPLDVSGKKLRVEIVEAYEGAVFGTTHLAEVAINFTEGERTKAVEKVNAWRTSKEGEKLQVKHDADVVAAFDAHMADSDEDTGIGFLMDAAGEGAPFLRKKVSSLVGEGYRAAALVPDDKAMEALLKLKDPNGIPGLELAALRAIGKEQKQIRSNVEYFYAYADLLGGGRRNIKAWGESGWEPGALRSFGEPLAVEIDRFGQVWVSDTANNRLQRFTQDGISDKQWGAQKDVTEAWFTGRRTWYAAGANASEEAGSFVNTVDVALIPGKEDDRFAVLDARGRVQVFSPEGNLLIGWTVRTDNQMQDKVGGEGYLAWLPKKKALVAFVGDEAVAYALDGKQDSQELFRWEVEDGTPNAVEVGKDGRLYMTFGSDVIAYNTDGFRYGKVFGDEILGEGFEDVDLTVDEEGRLWALTDTGWVFNFKKPGKLEWKVQISEVELIRPRFAVSQGLVFYTDRDRVVKVDALQRHEQELADAAEKAAAGEADAQ
jgi:hypothetical protein